jgi:lipocalin
MCVPDGCVRNKWTWFSHYLAVTVFIWCGFFAVRISPLGRNFATCPYVRTAGDFNVNTYVGRWYEWGRSASVPQEWERGSCQTAYYAQGDSNYIRVYNNDFYIDQDKFNNDYRKYEKGSIGMGQAQCSSWRRGHCQVRFGEFLPWSNYDVIVLKAD